MRKIYTFIVASVLVTLPLQVFAAVDFTLTDTSVTDVQSISIDVDTGADTLTEMVFGVEYSEDVTIGDVEIGTAGCDTIEYTDIANVLTITCTLEEEAILEGTLATISFTSEETDYTFAIVDDTTMDLGDLVLGTVVNVDGTTVTGDDVVTTTEEIPVSEDFVETTDALPFETVVVEESSGFSMENITDYLPYVLIAGSVVLLISIIGILLSKKKETTEEIPTTNPLEEKAPEVPVQSTEPTLKDMVGSTPEQPEVTPTPEVQAPPIQAMPQVASPEEEAQDLQALVNKEASPTPEVQAQPMETPITEAPVTNPEPQVMESMAAETPVTIPETQPMDTPMQEAPVTIPETQPLETVMPDTNAPQTPEDLQNQINNEINQMAANGQMPPVDTPVTSPAEESTDDLPPVPPTM